jgi:hypothetical protein
LQFFQLRLGSLRALFQLVNMIISFWRSHSDLTDFCLQLLNLLLHLIACHFSFSATLALLASFL